MDNQVAHVYMIYCNHVMRYIDSLVCNGINDSYETICTNLHLGISRF